MRAAGFSRALAALALLCAAPSALAQSTYPTQYGGRVAGVVPLVCDTNGANCQPNGSAGAVAPQIQGNVASGVADTGNPVKIGGVFNTSPITVTNGQRADFQVSASGSQYVVLTDAARLNSPAMGFTNGADANTVGFFGLATIGFNQVYNGTSWDRVRGDLNGMSVQPALSSAFWSFAPATGGIVNTTTAVTIKAAAGASVRNYLCSLQISHDLLGAATELAIRDGAAGTVLWRGKLQTAVQDASGTTINLYPCLRGTANTLLEVVTLTAVTGGVFVNAQGYTGS